MEDTCVLNSFSGVSSGTSTYGEEIRDAVDAREFSVWMEDLWDTAADVRDDRAVDTRPGILKFLNVVYRMATCAIVQSVMVVKSLRSSFIVPFQV